MKNKGIKKFSGKFIFYSIFMTAIPFLLMILFGLIWALSGDKVSMLAVVIFVIFEVACIWYVLFGLTYFTEKIPYKRSKELVEKQRYEGFSFSYYFNFKQDFFIVDEVKGRLGVVTAKNPYEFQIIDASEIEKVTVFPQNIIGKISKIGVIIQIDGEKYKAFTYNGIGWKYINYIDMNSNLGKECYQKAHEFATHIMKAKEVSLVNKGI